MSQKNTPTILASLTADSIAPASDTVSPKAASALFWRARYLQEAAILPHLPFIFWLSSILRPRSYVETGMTAAVSYFAVCQAVDKISPDGICIGIWHQENGNTGEIPEQVHWRNTEFYTEFSNIVTEPPTKVAANIRDGSVDLLLINLKDDDTLVEDWTSKLSERAVVLLHGTCMPGFSDTSSAAVLRDLGAHYPTIHFDEGDGLSVLLWGAERHEQLLGLADLTSETPGYSDVRQVFRRLGAAHRFEWISRKGRQNLQERQRDLERLQEDNNSIRVELREYTNLSQEHGLQVANLEARLHDLKAEGAARDDRSAQQIAALEAEREEQAQRHHAAEEALSLRNGELEARLQELEAEGAARDDRSAQQIAALEAEREEQAQRHHAAEEALSLRNGELEARLQELEAEGAARDDRSAQQIAALEAEREEQAQRHHAAEEALSLRNGELEARLHDLKAEGAARDDRSAQQIAALEAEREEQAQRHHAAEEALSLRNGELEARLQELEAEGAARDDRSAQQIAALEAEREEQAQRHHAAEEALSLRNGELEARLQELEAEGAARDDRSAQQIAALEAEREEQAQRHHAAEEALSLRNGELEARLQELEAEGAARDDRSAQQIAALEAEREEQAQRHHAAEEALSLRNGELEARLQELEAEGAARDDRSAQQIAALEAEREEQAQRHHAAEEALSLRNGELEARLQELEAEGAARDDRSAQQIAALEAEREEQAQRLRGAEARSEELLQERFREIASLTTTLEEERLQALTLRRDAEASIREADTRHHAAEEALSLRNGELEVRLQELEAEGAARDDRSAQQIAALEAEREEQAQRLRGAEARSEELLQERFREIASLTTTLEEERLQALAMQKRYNELQETLTRNKGEAEFYREQFDSIKMSTFWRMTSPARGTIDRLRALRGKGRG